MLLGDYLQLEVDLRTESRTKKIIKELRLVDRDESSPEEEEEDYGFYYLPVPQSQQPADQNSELDNTNLPAVQPSQPEKERETTDSDVVVNDYGTKA